MKEELGPYQRKVTCMCIAVSVGFCLDMDIFCFHACLSMTYPYNWQLYCRFIEKKEVDIQIQWDTRKQKLSQFWTSFPCSSAWSDSYWKVCQIVCASLFSSNSTNCKCRLYVKVCWPTRCIAQRTAHQEQQINRFLFRLICQLDSVNYQLAKNVSSS